MEYLDHKRKFCAVELEGCLVGVRIKSKFNFFLRLQFFVFIVKNDIEDGVRVLIEGEMSSLALDVLIRINVLLENKRRLQVVRSISGRLFIRINTSVSISKGSSLLGCDSLFLSIFNSLFLIVDFFSLSELIFNLSI